MLTKKSQVTVYVASHAGMAKKIYPMKPRKLLDAFEAHVEHQWADVEIKRLKSSEGGGGPRHYMPDSPGADQVVFKLVDKKMNIFLEIPYVDIANLEDPKTQFSGERIVDIVQKLTRRDAPFTVYLIP